MTESHSMRAQAPAGAGRRIYLDNQATTPTDPRVVEAMLPFFGNRFGNPHSVHHAFGWEAEEAVEQARAQVADLIGADPREVIFTSGATESNNLAIKGAARFHKERRKRVVTVATEHKCVLESVRDLAAEGFDVVVVPVGPGGLVDLDALSDAVSDDTAVVSVMTVNNEIGVIQPIAEIAAVVRPRGAYLHTDAAQAAGKMPLDVRALDVDLMSLTGHKIYGPMGIGALYTRRRPRVRLSPLLSGGGQERGLRSGTLPAPLVVGFGVACAIAAEEQDAEEEGLRELRDRLLHRLTGQIDGVSVNGDMQARVPGNLNLRIEGVDAEAMIADLRDVAISSGSACTSASVEPSYVLRALGLSDADAHASVRISVGRFNTADDIDVAADRIAAAVARQRQGQAP